MMRYKIATNHRSFVLAGKSIFTIENSNTNNRYTYQIKKLDEIKKRHPHQADMWFVSVLTGSNNETDYTFIGTIREGQDHKLWYKHSDKTRIARDAQSVKAIIWFLINIDSLPPNCNFYHEGMCARCGRTLTVPESILSGYGPSCIKVTKTPRPPKEDIERFVAENPQFSSTTDTDLPEFDKAYEESELLMKQEEAQAEFELEMKAFEEKFKREG